MVTKEELMWINNFLGLVLGGAATGSFVLWRKLIEAKQRDREIDTKHADDRETVKLWKGEVLRKEEEVDRLRARLDVVSEERNNAVQRLGSLEAHIEHLSEQVESLQAENRELKAMVQSMAMTNKQILQKLEGGDHDIR